MLDEIKKNKEELTKEWVINYFDKKIKNHEFFSFGEIKLMEACGKKMKWYCMERSRLTYEKGDFYFNNEKVEDNDFKIEWCALNWVAEPIILINSDLLEDTLCNKIIFTEDAIHKIILRYLQNTYDLSYDKNHDGININITIAPSNRNNVVYLGKSNTITVPPGIIPTYYGHFKKPLDTTPTCIPNESMQAILPEESEFINSSNPKQEKNNIVEAMVEIGNQCINNLDFGFPKELLTGKKKRND